MSYIKEDDFDVRKYITRILREMPEGAEISLNMLNQTPQMFRMYELYEIVQEILGKNFQLFKFTRVKNLGESVILKAYLR